MAQKIYRHILRDAWSVTWRHPALWVLGAFAFFMGQTQFFYSLAGLFKITSVGLDMAHVNATGQSWFFPSFVAASGWDIFGGIISAALLGILMILFFFLVIQAQGALVAAGEFIFRKRIYSFKAAWIAAFQHFWAILGILVVKGISALIVTGGVSAIRYMVEAFPFAWWPKVIFVLGFALLAVFDICITFIALYATCYIVLEKMKLRKALACATNLFAKHWLASLEIGVIFLVLNTVFLIVSKLVFAVLWAPLFYFAILVKLTTGLFAPAVIVNLAVLFIACWVVMAIYTTWFFMSVVALFDHMVADSPVSKVIRFLGSFARRG